MLAAAVVCPAPPLLVPAVASGAAGELDPLRAACAEALTGLARARPDRLVVVGATDRDDTGPHPAGAVGSLRPIGVELTAVLGAAEPSPQARPLPLSLTVGAWLLHHVGWAGPVAGHAVAQDAAPAACLRLGAELVAGQERVALLVLGEGTACREPGTPGELDAPAATFDAGATAALANADTAALAALDAAEAARLTAVGRAPWQVLAGAAGECALTGRLLREEAPYGVGYVVALWTAAG